MRLMRSGRWSVPLVMFGLALSMFGCSGDQATGRGVVPPTKDEAKKIAEQTKADQQERMKAMRGQRKAKGGG